jgi:hypothetical protein
LHLGRDVGACGTSWCKVRKVGKWCGKRTKKMRTRKMGGASSGEEAAFGLAITQYRWSQRRGCSGEE